MMRDELPKAAPVLRAMLGKVIAEEVKISAGDDRAVKCRQSLFGARPGIEQRTQFLPLLGRELRLGAGLSPGHQRIDPAAAITADPLIHELTGSTCGRGDLLTIKFALIAQTRPGDQHHTITIPLLGVDRLLNNRLSRSTSLGSFQSTFMP